MNAKGILLVALAAAAIAAAYQSQSPKPKHLKLGKRQCLWIPTTPADTPASDSVSDHDCMSVIMGYSIPPLASTPSIEVICGQG